MNRTRLVLLVGSNPLPNYLVARSLVADELVLVHTPQTDGPCRRLQEALAAASCKRIQSCRLDEAVSAEETRDRLLPFLGPETHLNYTGGTKVMAAHARLAHYLAGGLDREASYLDERTGLLRFDDGTSTPLDPAAVPLALDTVLQLHGTVRTPASPVKDGGPGEDAAQVLALAILADPELGQRLYRDVEVRTLRKVPLELPLVLPGLASSSVGGPDWSRERTERWAFFLRGGWLEVWVAGLLKALLPDAQIEANVECRRPGHVFEIDVATVLGHRLHVLSCTIEPHHLSLLKSKAFEVAIRARHMGGDLARSALVSLVHPRSDMPNPPPLPGQLKADIAATWDAPNTPAIFGLAELREWAGIGLSGPRLDTLKDWLELQG